MRAFLDKPHAFLDKRYTEPLQAIAEECHDVTDSVGRRLARERNLRWYNIDMTSEERYKAGILAEQSSRPISQGGVTCRVPSDDVREQAWVDKLTAEQSGTTIVIRGYTHFPFLVQKLRTKGCPVDERVYVCTVPEIRLCRPMN